MNVLLEGATTSSGCESGWTLYLEHSNDNINNNNVIKVASFYGENGKKISGCFNIDEDNYCYNVDDVVVEEEDLSMVSDASSGPPHFDHDINEDDEDLEEVFCYGGRKKGSINLSTYHHQCLKGQDFDLDDTASSPIFTPKKNVDNKGSSLKRIIDCSSQGFSTNHLHKRRSSDFEEHYDFIQSPLSRKQFRQNQWA